MDCKPRAISCVCFLINTSLWIRCQGVTGMGATLSAGPLMSYHHTPRVVVVVVVVVVMVVVVVVFVVVVG